jgi:hypothetical protein
LGWRRARPRGGRVRAAASARPASHASAMSSGPVSSKVGVRAASIRTRPTPYPGEPGPSRVGPGGAWRSVGCRSEEGAEQDADEGVGQSDEDAGGDVAGPVRGIAYSTVASSPRGPARWWPCVAPGGASIPGSASGPSPRRRTTQPRFVLAQAHAE